MTIIKFEWSPFVRYYNIPPFDVNKTNVYRLPWYFHYKFYLFLQTLYHYSIETRYIVCIYWYLYSNWWRHIR